MVELEQPVPGTERRTPLRVRVVLADDTTEIRMLVRLGLELDGRFEIVAEAGDGEAAVRACRDLQPDVAVLDLAMPVMDGLEAIPHVREVSPHTQIVVLSAFSSNHMAAEARRAGADAYVEKGGASDHLARVLGELAGASGPAAAVPPAAPAASALSSPDGDATTAAGRLEEILESVRHELRTPLALAAGFADLLAVAVDDGDLATARQRLDDVRRNVAVAQRLLSRLATEEETAPVGAAPVADAAALVRDLAPDLRALAPHHRIALGAPQRVPVAAPDDSIAQIVTNLVTNAAKFSPEGTTVHVTVAEVDGRAEIAVRDHGPGVPAGDEDRVFERFGRLERDRGAAGMGLGLWLSRRLARALGGDLGLERPEGGGARFVLRLPLVEATA
ncbi:MAG TPA: ATP-binding protein [Acidimicrobiales bacterium]|nr:ATP-binding protein [Acidimicrobiales bacterium]